MANEVGEFRYLINNNLKPTTKLSSRAKNIFNSSLET